MTIYNNIHITQKQGITIDPGKWKDVKNSSLNEAITIFENYPAKVEAIKQLAIAIQKTMNRGKVDDIFITLAIDDLKKMHIPFEEAYNLINNLLILAKHNNGNKSDTKWNYFWHTNKTRSLKLFLRNKS